MLFNKKQETLSHASAHRRETLRLGTTPFYCKHNTRGWIRIGSQRIAEDRRGSWLRFAGIRSLRFAVPLLTNLPLLRWKFGTEKDRFVSLRTGEKGICAVPLLLTNTVAWISSSHTTLRLAFWFMPTASLCSASDLAAQDAPLRRASHGYFAL